MKKLYLGAIASLLVLGIASCGKEKVYDATILADDSVDGYCLLGPATHKVGDTFIKEWGGFDGTSGKLEATSLATVAKYDKKLADSLESKKPVALYTIEDVHVATDKLAGWTTKWGDAGEDIDGAYCLKTGIYAHDEENDADAVSQWIPSKESGKVLSLTPKTYWVTPNFAEELDENGYDWNTNPVVSGGAGVYNVYLAKFSEAIDDALYGIGLVRTEKLPEYVNPLTDKGWKLTGSFNEWKPENGTVDFLENNTITKEFAANDTFKITKVFSDDSGSWGGELGWSAVQEPATGFKQGSDKQDDGTDKPNENIVCETAGTYTITVVDNSKITIVAAN